MKIRVAVCDDQEVFAESVKRIIRDLYPAYEVVTFNSGKSVLVEKRNFEIYILDIEMPEINGVEVARALRNNGFEGYIIFLTSHPEIMQEAFKVRAFRFLTKPIDKNKLKEALKTIEEELIDEEIFLIDSFGVEHAVHMKEIIYIEAQMKKTVVTLKDGSRIDTAKSIMEWERNLPKSNYFKVHRSYIVSLEYINRIEEGYLVIKKPNITIPVARRREKELKDRFFDFINEHSHII